MKASELAYPPPHTHTKRKVSEDLAASILTLKVFWVLMSCSVAVYIYTLKMEAV
jgi:hypothetical protein